VRIDPLRTVSVDRLASAYTRARVSPAIGGGNLSAVWGLVGPAGIEPATLGLEIRPEVRTKTHTAAACHRIRELQVCWLFRNATERTRLQNQQPPKPPPEMDEKSTKGQLTFNPNPASASNCSKERDPTTSVGYVQGECT